LRKRASVVCVNDRKLLTVALEDPFLKLTRLYLPGGEIEGGIAETAAQAAIREAREETGWQLTLQEEQVEVLDYDFFWNGTHVPCRTYFFPAHLLSEIAEDVLADENDYQRGVEWLPLDRLDEEFGYHPRILCLIQKMIAKTR